MSETWLPVVGYEGLYEVSDRGSVKSLERMGVSKVGYEFRIPEKILRPTTNAQKVLKVVLSRDGRSVQKAVHHLVLRAFVGEPGPGEVAHHKNGDQSDCTVDNLEWGPRRVHRDGVCKRGHFLVEPNLLSWEKKRGVRDCRACNLARARARSKPMTEKELQAVADAAYERIMSE